MKKRNHGHGVASFRGKPRKGISPLIAAVLMVVFTVAISAIVVNWMASYASSTTASASNSSTGVLGCSQQNVGIEAIYVTVNNSTGGLDTFRVSVANTGTGGVTLTAANAFNNTGTICGLLSSSTTLSQGSIAQLTNSSCDILDDVACADFSTVRVTTYCGLVVSSPYITKCNLIS